MDQSEIAPIHLAARCGDFDSVKTHCTRICFWCNEQWAQWVQLQACTASEQSLRPGALLACNVHAL